MSHCLIDLYYDCNIQTCCTQSTCLEVLCCVTQLWWMCTVGVVDMYYMQAAQ